MKGDLVPQVSCFSHSCEHYLIKCKTRSQLRQKYSDEAKEDKEETKKNTMLASQCLNTDLNVVSWGLKLLKDMLNDWFLRDIPLFEERFLPTE